MKLGPVTKLDKRNKKTSKKVDHDIRSENCDVIAISPIYALRPVRSILEVGFRMHSL